jgi:hypothetical protein
MGKGRDYIADSGHRRFRSTNIAMLLAAAYHRASAAKQFPVAHVAGVHSRVPFAHWALLDPRDVWLSRGSAVRAVRLSRGSAVRAVRLCAPFGCARGSAVRAVRLCARFGC